MSAYVLGKPTTGPVAGVKAEAVKWGAIAPAFAACRRQKDKPQGSPDFIKLTFRTPSEWICDPAVDLRFMPAGPVGANFELGRERAVGDLAVDGRPGQPGPGENGFQADDTIWFSHGRAASC